MSKLGPTIACFLIVSAPHGLVQADDLPIADVGSRIRVNSPALQSSPLVGTLATVDRETLSVVLPAAGPEESYQLIAQRISDEVHPGLTAG